MTKRTKRLLILAAVMSLFIGILTACTPPADTKVTGVTLDQTEITVEVGKTVTLTADVTPAEATNKKVVWSVDDDDYATVDQNGVVTGIATGFATVTATTEDGSFTASCDVEVIEAKGELLFEKAVASGEKTSTVKFYSSQSYDLSGAATAYDEAGVATTLDIVDIVGAKYEVNENRMIFLGGNIVKVSVAGTTLDFPLLSRQENDNGNFKLTLYVNNGFADFVIGEFTMTAAEAMSIGIDVEQITTIPVESVNLSETAITIVSGQNTNIANLVTVLPAAAAETASIEYSVKTQSTDETVVLSGSSIYAIKAGTATITVTAGGKSADLTITVVYPASPYVEQATFDEEMTFTGVYELKMGDAVLATLNSQFVFGTDGFVYEKLLQSDGNRFGSSMGYYNVVKSDNAITSVEVRLFENAPVGEELPAITFTYSATEDAVTLTDANTGDGSWGQIVKNNAKPFANKKVYRTYIAYPMTDETTGEATTMEISQTMTFETDGSYTFKWVMGVEIISETGTYSVVGNTIQTTVSEFINNSGDATLDKISEGSFAISTNEQGLEQIVFGDGVLVEYLGDAFTAETKYYVESVLDLSAFGGGIITTTYEFTFKADGTYTAVLKMNDEILGSDTGLYGVVGDQLTCKVLTSEASDAAYANASNGTFTITENDGKKQFTVGTYTVVEVIEEA